VKSDEVNDDSRKDSTASSDNSGASSKPSAVAPPRTSVPPESAGAVVPNKASEDDPRAWGDSESDNDHDAWLKEQKPPHWG
jgi:hypothetical protein